MASTYVSIKIKLKDGRLNKKDKEGQLAMMSIISPDEYNFCYKITNLKIKSKI